jgi:hypothetical protein
MFKLFERAPSLSTQGFARGPPRMYTTNLDLSIDRNKDIVARFGPKPASGWPERLLHIPTMSSVERYGAYMYGEHSEPHYVVLSYTWGRYKAPSGSSISISGLQWEVPAIDPEHFSVQELQNLIAQVGTVCDWLWIDIACINQQDEVAKAREVGRQAGIFSNAGGAIVWLNRTPKAFLQAFCEHCFWNDTKGDTDSLIPGVRPGDVTAQSTYANALYILHNYLDSLFSDPWFTSLWTLQENLLRRDALPFSSEGYPLTHEVWGSVNMWMISNFMSNVYKDLVHSRRLNGHASAEIHELEQRVMQMLERFGYDDTGIKNPNKGYSLAQHRVTKRPLDRIYGIMQTYELRLGKSQNPAWDGTLEDLVDELAESLVNRSPMLSQMFTHKISPPDGKSWRITQNIRIPPQSEGSFALQSLVMLEVTEQKTMRVLQGWSCSFRTLSANLPSHSMLSLDLPPSILQHHVSDLSALSLTMANFPKWYEHPIASILNNACDVDSLQLLLLGLEPNRSLAPRDLSSYGEYERPCNTSLFAIERDVLTTARWHCMIVLRSQRDGLWRRVGYCSWEVDAGWRAGRKFRLSDTDWKALIGDIH